VKSLRSIIAYFRALWRADPRPSEPFDTGDGSRYRSRHSARYVASRSSFGVGVLRLLPAPGRHHVIASHHVVPQSNTAAAPIKPLAQLDHP
jgi:hypothetical protein